MSFDPITHSAVMSLKRQIEEPFYQYFPESRTVIAERNAIVIIRALGAGAGGGSGDGSRGGNGGTVAVKELHVAIGDSISVVIPAGGAGFANTSEEQGDGSDGGDLIVSRNGTQELKVFGAKYAAPHDDPEGADWFFHGTEVGEGKRGGGAAMILEKGTRVGQVTNNGGAGVLGDGGLAGGGLIGSAQGMVAGKGVHVAKEDIILRIALNYPAKEHGNSAALPYEINAGGVAAGERVAGSAGGFGGGGGSAGRTGYAGGHGGFGGGGGGGGTDGENDSGRGGSGGIGGGGGGFLGYFKNSTGDGGQGWVTLEWRYI